MFLKPTNQPTNQLSEVVIKNFITHKNFDFIFFLELRNNHLMRMHLPLIFFFPVIEKGKYREQNKQTL